MKDRKYTGVDSSDSLMHYGVKGMKWGHRKAKANRYDPYGRGSNLGYSQQGMYMDKNGNRVYPRGVKLQTYSTYTGMDGKEHRRSHQDAFRAAVRARQQVYNNNLLDDKDWARENRSAAQQGTRGMNNSGRSSSRKRSR